MGTKLFHRKYQVEKKSFHNLLDIIKDHLRNDGSQRLRGATPNATIVAKDRPSMALWYCAGGETLDIADIHVVGQDEVTENLWNVVDVIHNSPVLNIMFPESHTKHNRIADDFKCRSDIDIDCCIGATDGILIWIIIPSKLDDKMIKFGPAKFFCGRKKTFGLNMQTVYNSRGIFLNAEIQFLGATSDFYAFNKSDLRKKLEKEGNLCAGFCLFGDNAYVQAPYMCTPWKNVGAGLKDAFDSFQSQVRINIEYACGMLIHRWGIPYKPIPVNITVKK